MGSNSWNSCPAVFSQTIISLMKTDAESKNRRLVALWKRALWMADRTPEARNRYVDLLRALSILAVVLGHWLISAPYFRRRCAGLQPPSGSRAVVAMADLDLPGDAGVLLRWWVFQRSFLGVGAAQTPWLLVRGSTPATRRLIGPVLPLLLMWGAMVAVAHSNGVSDAMIRIGSKVALVPVWFLAVYIMVVALVPVTHAAWKRWGFASIVVPSCAAALIDIAFFAGDLRTLGWFNYLFVWLTVHQLGYAWHDRRLAGVATGLALFVVGVVALVADDALRALPIEPGRRAQRRDQQHAAAEAPVARFGRDSDRAGPRVRGPRSDAGWRVEFRGPSRSWSTE